MKPDEETRASEYRRMMTARAANELDARFAAHPGDKAAAAEVRADWAPHIDPIRSWDALSFPDDGEGLQVA